MHRKQVLKMLWLLVHLRSLRDCEYSLLFQCFYFLTKQSLMCVYLILSLLSIFVPFGLINIMFLAEIMLVLQAKAVPLYLVLHHLKGFHFLLCCAFFHSAIMIYE